MSNRFLNHFEGYAASMALAKDDKNLIKCAISVAPTTDWLFYGKLELIVLLN